MSSEIVARFAPSPSGKITAGNMRTCLYSYLFAKSKGGKFILRLEDSDPIRSKKEYEDSIMEALDWLGLKSDVPIVRQSERAQIYAEYVQKLLDAGWAYKCYCSKETLIKKRDALLAEKKKPIYDGTCRDLPDQPGKPYTVRFKMPTHGSKSWKDLVYKKITMLNVELGDFIIQRQDGSVGYLLSNVIDDALQGVTHIVRGQDGISNLLAQTHLYEALGFPMPTYAHLPFVVNENGEKLSKRNGDDALMTLKDKGYLPEAVINALVRIGWSCDGTSEIFSMGDLLEKFDIRRVGKTNGVFDYQKLLHVNSLWMKRLPSESIKEYLKPFIHYDTSKGPDLKKVAKLLQPRSKTLIEMAEQAECFYNTPPKSEFAENEVKLIRSVEFCVSKLDEFSAGNIDANIKEICELNNITLKELGPILRQALLGKSQSPPIVDVMEVLGKKETIKRLKSAIK